MAFNSLVRGTSRPAYFKTAKRRQPILPLIPPPKVGLTKVLPHPDTPARPTHPPNHLFTRLGGMGRSGDARPVALPRPEWTVGGWGGWGRGVSGWAGGVQV